MVKKVGKYELGRSLGEGTFGKVKHAIDTETNEAVAIKILDKEKIQKQNMGNQIKKEISIMKMVKHKNIVGMVEVLASKTKIFIVLELVTGGELFDKIVSAGKLTEDQARFYFQQLIEGVDYCHKLGICHRDLKPENLLLDEHGNLKISDFGLSSLYVGDADGEGASRTELLHTTCGTPNYVAPEVLSDQGYDGKKADVWSCGVILYVLIAGFLPFDEQTIVALFAKIQNADFTYPSWFSPEVRALLDQMLVADPKARITIANILRNPWFLANTPHAAHHTPAPATGAPHTTPTPPTEAQVANAVKEQEDELDHGDHDNDNDDVPKEIVRLNAFDLVSQCGGFMLDKTFAPEIHYLTPQDYTGSGAEPKPPSRSGAQPTPQTSNTHTTSNKVYHYTAPTSNPQSLVAQIYQALQELGFDFAAPMETCVAGGLVRGTVLTAKGMVGMTVQVFILTPNLSLVEIKRGKGDLMEFHNTFKDFLARVAHLLNVPKGDGDVKEYY